MALRNPKRLVIDASVASAYGKPEAIGPHSVRCREFLYEFRKLGHAVVMTVEIQGEWYSHASRYATLWLTLMEKKGKRLFFNVDQDLNLRQGVKNAAQDDGGRDLMLKDIILIEAAITADQIVVSLDETVRRHFKAASQSVMNLRAIVWVNPGNANERSITWLHQGAKSEPQRLLGYMPPLA